MDPRAATELIQATAVAAAVSRLVWLNLSRQFPALVAYLVFLAGIDVGFGLLDPVSILYFWSYIALEPVKWAFSVFAIRELFSLTFSSYPGIKTVGRWAMYSGLALALAISLLMTRFFWSAGPHGRSIVLFYFEVSQRSVVFTLAFVIVTILVVLSKYPLHLSRNTIVSSVFFSVVFLSEAFRLITDSLAPRLFNEWADWAQTAFVSISLVGWAAALRPEAQRVPAQVRFPSPEEDHLLQQLNALNQMMTRSARR